MVGDGLVTLCACRWWALVSLAALALVLPVPAATAQMPPPRMPPPGPGEGLFVSEVRLMGNRSVKDQDIRAQLLTRPGRPFDPMVVQKDVRSLVELHKFFDVKVKTQPGPSPQALIVIFEVFEFPKLEYIQFIGNDTIKAKTLEKESGLKVKDPMSLSAVDDGRQKIEAFYKSHGYNMVRVEVREGLNSGDRGAVFVIDEGQSQQIWSIDFTGNVEATSGRLKTQISSSAATLKYFKGFVDYRLIDEDVERLTAYYHGLGYARARVGRELRYDETGRWVYLTFVIDEGPRYRVRSVTFNGNRFFGTDQLLTLVELKPGDYFDITKMNKASAGVKDAYGYQGFVEAEVKASPRPLETEPQLDLVYDITEKSRIRIGRLNVYISGEYPHTKNTVILNLSSQGPGQIANGAELNAFKARIRRSGIFATDPQHGPRIEWGKPGEDDDIDTSVADKSGNQQRQRRARGQSPDSMESAPRDFDRPAPYSPNWVSPGQGAAPTGPPSAYPYPAPAAGGQP